VLCSGHAGDRGIKVQCGALLWTRRRSWNPDAPCTTGRRENHTLCDQEWSTAYAYTWVFRTPLIFSHQGEKRAAAIRWPFLHGPFIILFPLLGGPSGCTCSDNCSTVHHFSIYLMKKELIREHCRLLLLYKEKYCRLHRFPTEEECAGTRGVLVMGQQLAAKDRMGRAERKLHALACEKVGQR
jgi:hypothetical protein